MFAFAPQNPTTFNKNLSLNSDQANTISNSKRISLNIDLMKHKLLPYLYLAFVWRISSVKITLSPSVCIFCPKPPVKREAVNSSYVRGFFAKQHLPFTLEILAPRQQQNT